MGFLGFGKSKKQKELERQLAQQQIQLNNLLMEATRKFQEPDALTESLRRQAQGVLNWAEAGDYRSLPKGIFGNFIDPAMRQSQRELITNAGRQGISALGTANPTILALAKQNERDIFDRDSAAQYQMDVGNAVRGATGMAGQVGSEELQKRLAILSNLTGQQRFNTGAYMDMVNRPGFWKEFLPFLSGTAMNAAKVFAGGG